MKIHDANTDIERQEKQTKKKRDNHQAIERKYHPYDTLNDVIRNEYKDTPQTKFTVRMDKELATSLRVYAEENQMSINQSIIYLCERHFRDNWITRGFFKLEKPFTVAIPIISQELDKYIDHDINCLIDLSCDMDMRLAMQSHLISKDETDYYLAVTFKHGNNYLDKYHLMDESYHADLKGYHIGLYDIYLEHLQTSVFIRVVFHDKTPIKATILTRKDAMKNAVMVDNQMLVNYLDNIEQSNSFENVKQSIRDNELYVKTLEKKVQLLEQELSELTDTNAENEKKSQDLEQTIEDMTDEKIGNRSDNPRVIIPKDVQKSIVDMATQYHSISESYRKTMTDLLSSPAMQNIQEIREAYQSVIDTMIKLNMMQQGINEKKSDQNDMKDD